MEEILHQLIDGKHPIILLGFQHVSTIQSDAGFRNHPHCHDISTLW